MTRDRVPDVTVIIPAYNAMPYLTECLTSLLGQSIGTGRLQIVTVNDGSTDATGEELDRFAAEHDGLIQVVHQKNSGGPGAPRNTGLGSATGRYVFFLDADDYLAPEALERMTAAADTHGSDVVLGKMAGVGGRRAPQSMFRHNQPRTDVFSSRIYWTLSPMKLFRRELIERLGLRFRTDLPVGEDQPFCAQAYIHASNVSVIADYDCVYYRKRKDGGNTTSAVKGAEPRVRIFTTMLPLIGEQVPAGRNRDHLVYRHLSVELHRALVLLSAPGVERTEQRRLFTELHEVIHAWHSEGAARKLPSFLRLEYYLVRHGRFDELLTAMAHLREQLAAQGRRRLPAGHGLLPADVLDEGGRFYARYPHFRERSASIPDHVYDVTREVPGVPTPVRRKPGPRWYANAKARTLRKRGTVMALVGRVHRPVSARRHRNH